MLVCTSFVSKRRPDHSTNSNTSSHAWPCAHFRLHYVQRLYMLLLFTIWLIWGRGGGGVYSRVRGQPLGFYTEKKHLSTIITLMIRMHLNISSNVENDDFGNLTLQFVPQIIKPRLWYHNSGGADQCMFSTSKRSFWSPLILLGGILLFLLTDGSMLLWIWWQFSGRTCPVMEHKLCYHHMPWGLIMESGIKCRWHTVRICCKRYSEVKKTI